MDNRKYTGLCGLYCRDCIPGNQRLYALIEELLREFEATGFANYATYKARRSPLLSQFPNVEPVLREILRLKCSGSCLEGPRSELGCATDCSIRKCVIERKLSGCWECAERMNCERIKAMASFHPGIYANLDAIAKYGMDSWVERRGKHYHWSSERPGRE